MADALAKIRDLEKKNADLQKQLADRDAKLAEAKKLADGLKKDNAALNTTIKTVQVTAQQNEQKQTGQNDTFLRYVLIAAENERLSNVIVTIKRDMENKLRDLERSLEEMKEREKKL